MPSRLQGLAEIEEETRKSNGGLEKVITKRVNMKENLKMMGGLAKIGAREHHLSKSEGDTSTNKNEKNKITQNSETVPHCPQRQRGRQKIERENARRSTCQSDRRVKQWARVDSSRQILCYRKKC